MKQMFLLIGLTETRIITDCSLSSQGLSTEGEYFIIGKDLGLFDTHLEAIEEMKETPKGNYYGFKIDMIYQP